VKRGTAMNVYDFDKTIYDGDSTVDFFLYVLKRKPTLIRYIPRQVFGFFLYFIRKIDKTRLKEYFFCFLKEINAIDLVEDFWTLNEDKIVNWYLRQQKVDDIVISASPEFLLLPICQRINIKNLIASNVDYLTGKFSGKNCYGEEKLHRLNEIYNEPHIDNLYTDSESDFPLTQFAKKSYLVRKGKLLVWIEKSGL